MKNYGLLNRLERVYPLVDLTEHLLGGVIVFWVCVVGPIIVFGINTPLSDLFYVYGSGVVLGLCFVFMLKVYLRYRFRRTVFHCEGPLIFRTSGRLSVQEVTTLQILHKSLTSKELVTIFKEIEKFLHSVSCSTKYIDVEKFLEPLTVVTYYGSSASIFPGVFQDGISRIQGISPKDRLDYPIQMPLERNLRLIFTSLRVRIFCRWAPNLSERQRAFLIKSNEVDKWL